MKGTCPKCKEEYYGWALQNPEHQHCSKCKTKLTITRIIGRKEKKHYDKTI